MSYLQVGTHVSVYWPDDDEWYKGRVEDGKRKRNSCCIPIRYDDGVSGWLDLDYDKFLSSNNSAKYLMEEPPKMAQKKAQVARLKVGARLSIWWPYDNDYFIGTLTKIVDQKEEHDRMHDLVDTEDEESVKLGDWQNRKPHFVVYDDGDEEWTNLVHRKYKPVEAKAESLHVGSRVAVYNKEKGRNFAATVTKIQPHRAKPHKVRYDKEKLGKQWLNLNVHLFIDICDKSKTPKDSANAINLKKRKNS